MVQSPFDRCARPGHRAFYNELRLTWLIAVIALRFIIDALNVVQRAFIRREMRFRQLARWKSAAPSHSALWAWRWRSIDEM
jgi:O-antigen/teichoic acid export membrane protein